MAKKKDEPDYRCSFCGKSRQIVKKIFWGPGVGICDECVDLCIEISLEQNFKLPAIPEHPEPINVKDLGLNPIFNLVEIRPRKEHCFYLGPFSEPFNEIYQDHIVPALESEGVSVERADEIFSTDALIEDIWTGIASATFVVADLTTKNANVLYEVGMAHTIGRPVIIITQDMNDVPFDLRHRRCIVYQHTPRGCDLLEKQLSGTTRFVLGRSEN